MNRALGDRACIVGIGETGYGKRGTFQHVGEVALAARAVRAACDDAGIRVNQVDGFCSHCDDISMPSSLAPELGITSWNYAALTWGGGGNGLPTAITNAVMSVLAGVADYVVVVRSIVQGDTRMGAPMRSSFRYNSTEPFGLVIPLAVYAMRARRYMAQYRVTSDHLAAVAITQREYAANNPLAVYRTPLSVAQHHEARVIVDPLRLYDCCMESDGATAVVVTSVERAKDLRQTPVLIQGVSARTTYRWDNSMTFTEPDDLVPTSGHSAAAASLWESSGARPSDVDVAGFYDGCTPAVFWALEDWGFCARGEGADFVADGNTRRDGALPVNTSGGQLSEAYQQGMGHLVEAVRQLRGTSYNQVPNAEVALYAAGAGLAPMGGVLLRR